MFLKTNNYFPISSWFSWGKKKVEADPKRDVQNARIGNVMQKALDKEQTLANKALCDISRRYPVSIVGSSVLNVGVLALEGASTFSTSAVLADFLVGFGLLGGLLNLGEGMIALKEGVNALKVGDKALAIRLISQGVLNCALGVAMTLFSIAKIAGIASITAFFAANPFILPALFFTLGIFLLIETLHRLLPIMKGTDLGSRLDLPQLRKIMENPNQIEAMARAKEWAHAKLGDCFEGSCSEENHLKKIQEKLDETKAEIGFLAAQETFRLLEKILKEEKKEEILDQLEKVENQIATWNKTLYLKFFSVLLAGVGFGVGIGADVLHSEPMDGAQNIAMSVASCVPLYLDTRRPFERETPIVITRPEEAVAHTA